MKVKKLVLVALSGILILFCLDSCQLNSRSPDKKYRCEKYSRMVERAKLPPLKETSWLVREVATKRVVFTTHAKYDTPNKVKAFLWSPDSKKFAAFYHYGPREELAYTWIGVWSLETGEFLYAVSKPGWIKTPDKEFPQPISHP
jgi:hypothetical protein